MWPSPLVPARDQSLHDDLGLRGVETLSHLSYLRLEGDSFFVNQPEESASLRAPSARRSRRGVPLELSAEIGEVMVNPKEVGQFVKQLRRSVQLTAPGAPQNVKVVAQVLGLLPPPMEGIGRMLSGGFGHPVRPHPDTLDGPPGSRPGPSSPASEGP